MSGLGTQAHFGGCNSKGVSRVVGKYFDSLGLGTRSPGRPGRGFCGVGSLGLPRNTKMGSGMAGEKFNLTAEVDVLRGGRTKIAAIA